MHLAQVLAAALILLDLFVWQQIFAADREGEAIRFLDVGQGDSILVNFANGAKVLTDAGPDDRIVESLARVLPDSDRYIDIGIITHAELDHYGGFLPLLERYSFGAIIWNGRDPDESSERWERLKAEIVSRDIPLVRLAAGDRVRVGKETVDVLSPSRDLWSSTELNDGCIVTKARIADVRALFTCDSGFIVERAMLEAGKDLHADVLKVGHHGSRFSSNMLFLEQVNPRVAAIQVGARNGYGHPSAEALGRIASATAAAVFRTDTQGTITVRSENGRLLIYTER